MKSQELRIGNYVFSKETQKHQMIVGVTLENPFIDAITFDYTTYNEIEPIPLTEQWLIDFGLLQDPNHKCFHIKGMEFHIPIMSGGYYDNEYGLDEENRITLFYVHQLQNLYFALTGQELQL